MYKLYKVENDKQSLLQEDYTFKVLEHELYAIVGQQVLLFNWKLESFYYGNCSNLMTVDLFQKKDDSLTSIRYYIKQGLK